MDVSQVKESVRAIMPEIMDELGTLVSQPSCAFPGFPAEPVHAARAQVMKMFENAGLAVEELDLEGGGYPAVWGEIPAPEGAPTVLLYGHYDVQPAPMDQGWVTDPWTPTMKDDGRMYGRGAADDKSGPAIHAGTLRVFGGKPPVGIKVIIEGEEETLSQLEAFVEKHPERFKADCMIIADMGNIECGLPVLTTMLRGHCQCIVEVRTIDHPLHSGVFGGPVPDAFVALIRLLNKLWDDRGNTLVPGLERFDWPGADYPEPLVREMAGVLPGVEINGDASIGSMLWSQPNATVIGIDGVPCIADAGNVLLPVARAKVALRIAPGADPEAEIAKLMDYLRANPPRGASRSTSRGSKPPTPSSRRRAARPWPRRMEALRAAYDGVEPSEVGSGGSIPLLETLMKASPGAEFILLGAEDAKANIHGANESVHPEEIERMIVAQALLIQKLAEQAEE